MGGTWADAHCLGRSISTVILVTFFGCTGTFFSLPGSYRQANTRPAGRPPSDWPASPRGETREAGRPGPPPPFYFSLQVPRPGSLSFHANNLAQRVDDFDQIALRRHHGFDRLVGRRRLVNDVSVLTALDARGHSFVVLHAEAPLGFRAGHRAAGP